MNGMVFRSFRKRKISQKNTNTVYSEYVYSEIVQKERALGFHRQEDPEFLTNSLSLHLFQDQTYASDNNILGDERDNIGYIDSFNCKEYIGSSCCPGLF